MCSQKIPRMLGLFRKRVSPIQLGRWSRTMDKYILDRKIELANHDHCGPCSSIELKSKPTHDESKTPPFALQSFDVSPKKNI